MRKWLRITLIVAGSIVALGTLLLLGLAWYIKANKADLLKQITEKIDGRINGTLHIGDVEPSIFSGFPNVSLALKDVQLVDSLYPIHHKPLLNVKYIYIRLNSWSLLRKHADIKEITLKDGEVFLFTDSTGYTNTSIFQEPAGTKKKPARATDIGTLVFSNILFSIENHQKQKLFELLIREMAGHVKTVGDNMDISIFAHLFSRHFEFNTQKGSYLKDKEMNLPLHVSFNRKTKVLEVPQQPIKIDNKPVMIGGQFVFATKPHAFQLKIIANQVLLKEAASWLPPNISGKLNTIDLQKPLDAEANLVGHMQYRDTPHVVVTWKTTSNVLNSGLGQWSACSFSGRFNNEVITGAGYTDENSAVNIFNLSALFGSVPVKADTIRVVNLKKPLLRGHFQSSFPLVNLNENDDPLPLAFSSGNAVADLNYTGPLMKDDPTPSALIGTVQVTNAAFTYTPRDLKFKNCNAMLRFTGEDLLLENIKLQTQSSSLTMDGKMKNVLGFYFTAPDKIVLDWNIQSPMVDLNEFKSFLMPRQQSKAVANARRKAKMGRVAKQLDNVLAASNVNMNVQLNKTVFRHFTADNVKAVVALTASDILLNQISLQHAGGTLSVKGKVHQVSVNNYFDLAASFVNVNISQLFYAFDNFGMKGLTSKNIRGIATAKTNIRGNILDNGTMINKTLNGNINFSMKRGALLDFQPLVDIGDFLFKRRRLDSITFESLSNNFQVQNGKIIIPPMRIASSALNIDMQGIYGIGGGTNLQLDVPLRNPAKDSAVTDKAERLRRSRKGIILHLHAVDGPDGKVKIKMGRGDSE
ncbi:AsmA family protein [Chitinophaga sp. Cy-1792]|uniref:AsmA family protein n=1 Tax=Chitinophaga sp. Cy-1792 TaxID=2608339 RepID=UPI0014200E56|nr:AsmA-like C-terminal region-containing protein [Chitinophaga sp. Cy-1792]NIG56204.1 hypothetical protein [Chitinophaga sp. Cy-1792]